MKEKGDIFVGFDILDTKVVARFYTQHSGRYFVLDKPSCKLRLEALINNGYVSEQTALALSS